LKSIAEAEIVLLLISAPEGVTDGDKKILAEMEKQGKAGVVLFNKWDLIQSAPEKYFSQLQARVPFGFYPCFAISALTGEGVFKVFDLVEEVYKNYTRQISTSELNRLLEKITSTYSPPRRGKEIKIYYGVEKKIKPPTFVLFVNHPQLLPSIYLKYLEKKFREKFNLWGTPVRFVVRRRK
jgi:GTP-binding protein